VRGVRRQESSSGVGRPCPGAGVVSTLLGWLILGVFLIAPATAQEWTTETHAEPDLPTQEVWVGATVAGGSWSVYSGLTMAPFGPITANGWRLRTAGDYGEYKYRGPFDATGKPVHGGYTGNVSFAEALIGYHQQWGPLTVKAFVGVTAENRGVAPFDPLTDVLGYHTGVKGELETWYNIRDDAWAALDLSGASVLESYSAHLRLGYRLDPDFSLGLEARGTGNVGFDGGQGGGLVRYTWSTGEISASAGGSVDRSRESGTKEFGGYATVNALYRYSIERAVPLDNCGRPSPHASN
jgi:hypothetical protein